MAAPWLDTRDALRRLCGLVDSARLTGPMPLHRLWCVRRLIAILIGVAVAASFGQPAALHLHVYTDHDHPEHHHGPAAHEHHHHGKAHADEGLPRLASCEPGVHAVSVTLSAVVAPHVDVVAATDGSISVLAPPGRLERAIEIIDVRAHSPPSETQAPPRAPPLISHA